MGSDITDAKQRVTGAHNSSRTTMVRHGNSKPKPKYEPTGKPKGRPPIGAVARPQYVPTWEPKGRKLGEPWKKSKTGAHLKVPDHLKVPKKVHVYVPTGKPKGRPPIGSVARPRYVPTGKPKGRPAKENCE